MKYLAFVLLLITCVGCSDDEIEPTKDTEALIDTTKTVEESVSKTDEEVVTEIPETDTPSIDLSAALRGKVLGTFPIYRGDNCDKFSDDLFVGQPLRYERKETGYLLYSQGPNRKDDSGRPHSDIVFQVPLPALDEN